jgi:hypothetical protein
MLECATLRSIRSDSAYLGIQLPQNSLTDIEARRSHGGKLTLRCPERTDRNGRHWPIFAPQRGTREAAARAVAVLWQHADLARGQ